MLVSEMFVRVRRAFGDDFGTRITINDLVRWANDGQREIAMKNELLQVKGSVPLVAEDPEYPFPANILKLLAVTYRGQPLEGMGFKEFLNFTQDSEGIVTGEPRIFTPFAGSLRLHPTPKLSEGEVALFYIRQPVDIVADDPNDLNTTYTPTTSELPQQYHIRLVEYMLAQAAELDDDDVKYERKRTEFETRTLEMKDDHDWNIRDEYPVISVLPSEYGDFGDYHGLV